MRPASNYKRSAPGAPTATLPKLCGLGARRVDITGRPGRTAWRLRQENCQNCKLGSSTQDERRLAHAPLAAPRGQHRRDPYNEGAERRRGDGRTQRGECAGFLRGHPGVLVDRDGLLPTHVVARGGSLQGLVQAVPGRDGPCAIALAEKRVHASLKLRPACVAPVSAPTV